MAEREVWAACNCCEGWRPLEVEFCPECSATWTPLGPPQIGECDAFGGLVTQEAIAGGYTVGLLFIRDEPPANGRPLDRVLVARDELPPVNPEAWHSETVRGRS